MGRAEKQEVEKRLDQFMVGLVRRNPAEPEFHQAVQELAESVIPFMLEHPWYEDEQILERMTEPDRIITFRVTWQDDAGNIRVNRAWRVQFNNAIGPYKGGLRFHKDVRVGVLKFLGFEQCFKNALTGLPLGGAKGGSNFNPKGKSDREVMRFCQALMLELHRYIGEDTDIPAGDIGVGEREISYLFGMYKKLENRFVGTLTGKGLAYGGSCIRKEATGYGCVYFIAHMLTAIDEGLKDKHVVVSGSGNVAIYAAERAMRMGAKIITLSDSDGFIHDPEGLNDEKLAFIKTLKEVKRGRISEYAEKFDCKFVAGAAPWSVPCDIAIPCATQNELDGEAAEQLINNKVRVVAEGANMPCTVEAVQKFREAGVLFAPAKAANAGGVAVSGLEQTQNAQRLSWTGDEVDQRLQKIMSDIHEKCVKWSENAGCKSIDYLTGANLGGFVKIADAMRGYGVV